jgi:secretion/DNA translocation related TadE-like protein
VTFGTRDAGTSTAVTAGIIALLMIVSSLIFFGTRIAITLANAHNLADRLALEAADTISGRLPGIPCASAQRLADEANISLVSCETHSTDARVTLRVTLGVFGAEVRAHAGPPQS